MNGNARRILRALTLLLAGAVLVLSAPYEYLFGGFLVEAASSLRLILCFLALPIMAACFFLRLKSLLVLQLLAAAINLLYVGPYLTARGHAGPANESGIKIVFMNVDRGRADPIKASALIAAERPDVLVVAEATPDFAQAIEAAAGGLSNRLSYFPPDEKTLGMLAFTSLPLREKKMLHFVETKSPQFELTLEGKDLRIITLHAHVPRNPFGYDHQRLLFERLSGHLSSMKAPSVVVGDFNSVMWAPLFRAFRSTSSLKDPRLAYGVCATWAPFGLPLLPIDHVLTSPEVDVGQLRAGPSIGSDHLPLIATVALPAPLSK